MNFIGLHKLYDLQWITHNEGKIKSYDSCCDVRAWSHDIRQRDRYLREWIKCDMPLSVPCSTLVGLFQAMTCGKGGRTSPRCHQDCKSKIILDGITTSCEAMRECLKTVNSLDKFFLEEEFETSHWPYERCLESLKVVKLFWKIALEKIFIVNISKKGDIDDKTICGENAREVAREWTKDMVQQAMFVKSLAPQLISAKSNNCYCCKVPCKKEATVGTPECMSNCVNKISHECQTHSGCNNQKRVTLKCLKINKKCECNIKKEIMDASCGGDCEIEKYKLNMRSLEMQNSELLDEVDQLRKEAETLKCELNKLKCSQKKYSVCCNTALVSNSIEPALAPTHLGKFKENNNITKRSPKEADSELLITMKKCRQETHKHVSLLQILHKTNDPFFKEKLSEGSLPCCKREDPVTLLTKVQATLGSLVSREMNKTKSLAGADSEIEATFEQIPLELSRDDLSCSYDDHDSDPN